MNIVIKQLRWRITFNPYAIFILAVLIYLKREFSFSWDLMNYLVYADNIVSGEGFVDVLNRPIQHREAYTFSLAGIVYIFGMNPIAIMGFESLWAAFLVLGLYLFSRDAFGEKIAIGAALIFVSTPGLIFYLPRHIDQIWPALAFYALWAFNKAHRSHEQRSILLWLILSGVSIGLAINTKSMAIPLCIVFIALPWIIRKKGDPAWISVLRSTIPVVSAYITQGLFKGLTTLLWGKQDSLIATSSRHAASLSERLSLDTLDLENAHRLLSKLVAAAIDWITLPVSGVGVLLPLWPLGVLGLFVISYLAIVKRTALERHSFVLAFWVMFPFAVYAGLLGLRASQNIFSVALFFVSLAWVLNALAVRMTRRFQNHLMACLILAASMLNWTMSPDNFKRINTRTSFLPLSADASFFARDPIFGASIQPWLQKGPAFAVDTGTIDVMVLSPQTMHAMRLHSIMEGTKDDLNLRDVPLMQIGDEIAWPTILKPSAVQIETSRTNACAVGIYQPIRKYPQQTTVFSACLNALVQAAQERDTRYLLVRDFAFGTWVTDFLTIVIEPVDTHTIGRTEFNLFDVSRIALDGPRRVFVDNALIGYFDAIKTNEPWRIPNLLSGADAFLSAKELTAIEQRIATSTFQKRELLEVSLP